MMKEAEQMSAKVIQLQDDLPEAYIIRGRIHENKNQQDEALANFKKGLEIAKEQANPDQKQLISAHFHLGCQYEKIKEFKLSVFHFKQCLLFDQQHFGSCIHLATQLANTGDFLKAEKYFRHCIKLNPLSVPAHFGLGKILA